MKDFRYTFLGNYESQKAETWYEHGHWSMYRAYRNSGQGPITLGVMFLSRFSYLCIYLLSMKNFRNTFSGNYESQKAETWYKHGQ